MKYLCLSAFAFLIIVSTNSFAQENEFHLDERYPISKSGTLYLSSDDAEVFIVGTERSDVHVKIDRVVETKGIRFGDRHFDVSVEEQNGDLRIEDKEWGSQSGFIGYSREEYVIRIELPETVNLNFIGDDDDYEISDIRGYIKMRVDDGNIRLERCLSHSYSFNVDDGDVQLDGAMGKLEASLDDGSLRVYNGNLDNIEIRGDDSDFEIETSLTDEGNYHFRMDDSDLNLHIFHGGGVFKIDHDDGRITVDRGFSLVEEDDEYSEFRLPGGSSIVHISGDDISVRLTSDSVN